MKKILFISAFALSANLVHAEGNTTKIDLKAGKTKIATCNGCHGVDGVGVNAQWPKLAGQNAKYTAKQLVDFKAHTRKDPIMEGQEGQEGQATPLTTDDINNIAAYYQTIPISYMKPRSIGTDEENKELKKRAEKLYRAGNLEKNIAACSSCHGPAGQGNSLAAYPAIAGQYAEYTAKQLKAFRVGSTLDELSSTADPKTLLSRTNSPNKIMQQAVSKLTDKDIEALAMHIQGLQP